MNLRDAFPDGRFSAPAAPTTLAEVERLIGFSMPECLGRLFRECDGFREPLGNAKYLLSLFDEDFIGSLFTLTMYWRGELPYRITDFDAASRVIVYGISSASEIWMLDPLSPGSVIVYQDMMQDEIEIVASEPLDLMISDFSEYNRDRY